MIDGITRREFIGRSSTAAALAGLGSIASGATLLFPRMASAKPGGHRAGSSECRSTFAIDYKNVKEEITLYLAGTGYASFDNVYDYAGFNVKEALYAPTVSMEWEVDLRFAGNRPDLGLVRCRALVHGRSSSRSGLVLIGGDRERGLFPATMINTLFVEIDLPNLGVTIFNKEPMLFRGETVNLDADQILADPRVKVNPKGVPLEVREVMNRKVEPEFNPVGFHALQRKNVEFYNRAAPDERVAVLLDAEIQTLMTYGVEVALTSASIDRNVVNVEWGVSNLLWDPAAPKPIDVIWYTEDSHELTIVGEKQGTASLGGEVLRIPVQATNASKTLRLAPGPGIGSSNLVREACIFCGVQNAPTSLDIKDFVAGFSYVDINQIRQRM